MPTPQSQVDPDGGINEAKRSGHGLLTNEEFQAKPIHLLFRLVNLLVAKDDRVGQLPVAFLQGLHAIAQGSFPKLPHLGDLAADTVNVSL